MAYKISGTILEIGQAQSIPTNTASPLIKQDVVITVRKYDQYTGYPTEDVGNTPKFIFVGEKCQQLSGLNLGDIITIHFDIQGRSFTKEGKIGYFTDIRPFRIEKIVTTTRSSSITQKGSQSYENAQPVTSCQSHDGIPSEQYNPLF